MNREYHKWWSSRLGRDMELLVFGHSGVKASVFPTSQGRFYEFEDRGMINALRHKMKTASCSSIAWTASMRRAGTTAMFLLAGASPVTHNTRTM